MYIAMYGSKNVKFGYCVVMVSLVNKINVSSLSEFTDDHMVFFLLAVLLWLDLLRCSTFDHYYLIPMVTVAAYVF